MGLFRGILLFYRKLIIPLIIFSILVGLLGSSGSAHSILRGIGLSYIFLTPLFQYFLYEIRNPEEYYLFYNLGLSRLTLWVSSLVISLLIGFTMILL